MQETIDAMFQINPQLLNDLNMLGTPEPVELLNDMGKITHKYFLFNLSDKEVID